MKKLSLICMTVLAVSILASCRGPQGPQGPQGPAGSANVASSTVTIPATYGGQVYDWEWNNFFYDGNNNPRGQYIATFDYPAINSNVFNYGAVLVYMDVDGTWSQVPLTYYYSPDDDEEGNPNLYEASIEVATLNDGGVRVFWTESDLWQVYPGTRTFKIVAIEATVYKDRSDVDYSNYEAVKTAFQLAD